MGNLESILDTLGNRNRRQILFLLAERPRFVTELSDNLNIGRKAIIEHLSLMEHAGIVFSIQKRISHGRPRKYFEIKREIFFNIGICPSFVDFSELKSTEEFEEIEQLDMEIDELEMTPITERRIAISYIINKLESRMEGLESEWVDVQRLLNRARKLLK